MLIVSHGGQSIALYAAQAALALGAARVDFASVDDEMLALAAKLGAIPMQTDFGARPRRYPIVVDYGLRQEGLEFALRCTEPEGICQSVSFYFTPMTMPLGKLYTLGIRFFIGRCHAAALLPEVIPLIEQGKLRPGEVTTRIVDWEDARDGLPRARGEARRQARLSCGQHRVHPREYWRFNRAARKIEPSFRASDKKPYVHSAGLTPLRGTLVPGSHADSIVVDRDPLTCRVEDLPGTRVLRTVLGGNTVHDAGGSEESRRHGLIRRRPSLLRVTLASSALQLSSSRRFATRPCSGLRLPRRVAEGARGWGRTQRLPALV